MDIIQGDNETIYVSNQAYGGLTKYNENQKKFIKVNADTNALFGGFNQFSPKSNNLVFVSSYARGVSWINLSTELTKSKYNTSYGNLTIDWISDIHYLTDSTFLIRGDDYKWRFYNKNFKEERFFSELGDFQKRPLDKYSKIILNDTIEALPGINCFYLLNKNFEPNLNKSKILIGSFKIDNELIYPANRPDLLTAPIEETKSITLPFAQNSFTINFFDQTEFNKDQVNYEYLLDGYNKNWVKSETKEIDFTNVQPGNYKLRIRAALFNNRKQSKETIIKITINAPWWKSNIAYAIYVIILGVFIYLFVKARTRYLVLKEIKLKEIIAENTRDIEKQKNLIEEKHKEITDSISYAERIQRSFIATNEILNENLKSYYVFFKPKDIVSGDFYWAAKLQNTNFAFLTADSTGHGVPGAIMSLLNITSVEKAVSEGHANPADILNFARKTIIERLKKDGSKEGGKDGMDCSLCIYDFKQMKLFTSSANNSIWIIRKNDSNVMEAIELKADKMPVGKHDRDNVPFTSQEFDLKSGDLVVTLTDGFPDQFGGEMGKKFMSKKLRELLINIAHLPLPEQKIKLENTFTNWIGNHEQVDDVTVVVVQV
jgi:serine phosphatase RsbU (regulator of sigma subunit)